MNKFYMFDVLFYWNPQICCSVLLLFWSRIILLQELECYSHSVRLVHLASLQFRTESCTRVSQHLTGHRDKYFHMTVFLDSRGLSFVRTLCPFNCVCQCSRRLWNSILKSWHCRPFYLVILLLQGHYFIWQLSFLTSRRNSAVRVGGQISGLF